MKKILLLLIGLTIISCSSDDADAADPDNFFSNHGGKVFNSDDGDWYIKIEKNNGTDGSVFLRSVYRDYESCPGDSFFLGTKLFQENDEEFGDSCENVTRTILSNTANVLSYSISVLYGDGDCNNLEDPYPDRPSEIQTYTIDGDVLVRTYDGTSSVLNLYEGDYPCS